MKGNILMKNTLLLALAIIMALLLPTRTVAATGESWKSAASISVGSTRTVTLVNERNLDYDREYDDSPYYDTGVYYLKFTAVKGRAYRVTVTGTSGWEMDASVDDVSCYDLDREVWLPCFSRSEIVRTEYDEEEGFIDIQTGVQFDLAASNWDADSGKSGIYYVYLSGEIGDVATVKVEQTHQSYMDENGICWHYTLAAGNTAILTGTTNALTGDVVVPDRLGEYCVARLAENAIFGHENLESLRISSNVTDIAVNAICQCSWLMRIMVDEDNLSYKSEYGVLYSKDGKTLVRYPEGRTTVAWGASVTNIADYAFANCARLTDVTIPETIRGVGENAFSGCSNLQRLETPILGFCPPENLRELKVLDAYLTTEYPTFWECPSLETLRLAAAVTNAYAISFGLRCESLTAIEVDSGNPCYASRDGVLYDRQFSRVIRCPRGTMSVSLPSTLSEIAELAFADCRQLTALEIPGGVTRIGRDAFRCCEGLTSVALPSGMAEINAQTFIGCTNLRRVEIPSSVARIGSSAFSCSGLEEVTLPPSVRYVCPYAFYGCNSLRQVEGASGLIEIGTGAFEECSTLTEISISTNLEHIGENAFYGCSSLGVGVVTLDEWVLTVNDECPSVVELGDDVRGLADRVFGDWDFDEFAVGSANKFYRTRDGVLYTMDGKTLVRCPTSKASIVIPTTVERIEEAACYHCGNLGEVTLPSNLISIGADAFNSCGNLQDIQIPASVKSIGRRAFTGCCFDEDEVFIRDGWLLCGCSNEEDVGIPEGILGIVGGRQAWCCGATNAIIPATVRFVGQDVFGDAVVSDEGFCVKDGWLLAASQFFKSMNIPSDVNGLVENVFADCEELETLTFDGLPPEGLVIASIPRWTEIIYNADYQTEWENALADLPIEKSRPNTREVRFDATGGSCSETVRQIVPGNVIGTLPVPTQSLYQFLGWYTAASGGTKVTEVTPVTADATYFAQWKKDGKVFVGVSVDASCAEGGTVSGGNGRYTPKTTLKLRASPKAGYRFLGWYLDEARVSTATSYSYKVPSRDISLVAKFAADPIAFDEPDDIECDKGEKISVTLVCESETTVTYAASGLPSGVKFNVKTLTISGAPTKVGAYTVKVTGTNKSGSKATVSFVINVGHLKKLTVMAYTDDDAAGGKVAGGGYYAPNTKVTLSATAARGWVFAGWSGLDESRVSGDIDLRTAKITYRTGDDDEEILAYFVSAAEDRASLGVSLKSLPHYDSSMSEWVGYTDFAGELSVGVMTTQQLAVTSLSLPTLTVTGLPKGLKFNASTYEIYGVPTKAGTYTTKATASNLSGAKKTVSFAVKVSALPKWAYGSYLGSGYLRTYSSGDSRLSDYCGPMAVNVSGVGKLSGYFLFSDKRYSFAKTGYDKRVDEVIHRCPQCGSCVSYNKGCTGCCMPSRSGYYCDSCQTQLDESGLLASTNVYFKSSVSVKVGSRVFQVPLTVAAYGNSSPEFGCEGLGCVSCDCDDSIPLLATTNPRDAYAYGWVAMAQSLVGRSDVGTLPAKTLKKCFVGEEDGETLGTGDWLTIRTYSTGKTLSAGRIGGNAVSWSSEFVPGEISDESFSGRSYLYAAPVKRTGFLGRFMAYELNVDRSAKTIEAGDLWNVSWD